jgi:glutamate N-acetyltransferase/amino-acid N-acetyltransferase
MNMQYIEGGICAPKGFQAAGVHCGIRKNKTKKDLALIVSKVPASAAGVYTQNKVQGAPITVTKANLTAQNGYARAIICNSGNANTCNPNGIEIAQKTCALVGETLSLPAESVLVASTGVIGMELSLEPFQTGIPAVVNALSDSGSEDAAHAIMTTDTVKKETAVSFVLDGKTCHIGAIAKGSGMIHPNMATLLCFITTDVAIGPALLQQALKEAVDESLNQVSIDGDTSTNDMALVMANGMAENKEITEAGEAVQPVCPGANGRLRRACQENCRRRGRGDKAPLLQGFRRAGCENRPCGGQIGYFLVAFQGRHVWRRRQLGTNSLRYGLCRCRIRYFQNVCGSAFSSRANRSLRKRGGAAFFRGKGGFSSGGEGNSY